MLAMLSHNKELHNSAIGPTSILSNLVCINDIDSLTIPGIHELPHAEVLQYINSNLV